MRWQTYLVAAAIVASLPVAAWAASEHDRPGLEPYLEQADETPAAPDGGAMGGMMPCPMMGQQMGGGPMPGMSAMPGHRAMGPGMAHERQAMGGPRGGMMDGMMGAMPGPDADPKTRSRWMQMHGEIMKAVGEILLRYGRELEAAK